MSFSKAKIQRFNDIKECTPSPAKYNVTLQDKIKLGIISQNGTYLKKQGSFSGSDTGSIHSTPCFQTPPVPNKKKFLGLNAFKTKTPKVNSDAEELREKIVECRNKDATINELTEQIEELKEKIGTLEKENGALFTENEKYANDLSLMKKQQEDLNLKYLEFHMLIKEISFETRMVRQQSDALKVETCMELSDLIKYIDQIQNLHCEIVKEKQDEIYKKEAEKRKVREEEFENLERLMKRELDETNNKLQETEAKLKLVEENFKEMSLFTEMQMKEKLEEIESAWKLKLEEKEKEYEAILKECQEISEYNIIQSEVEKNMLKNHLSEKEVTYNELMEKYKSIESEYSKAAEEISAIKMEKHAYELSITTFRDTIEVLKKRLISSDRDVEQLKEELEKCEEKTLYYEKKLIDLTSQLNELQIAKEDLEMQYESTSKLMQNEVKTVEKTLLSKVEGFQGELKQLLKDKELLSEVLTQYREQQMLITRAQDSIAQSSVYIENLEKKQTDLEEELNHVRRELDEETEEADQMRKKYIETSGKYDELLQQFEQVSLELKKTIEKNEELQKLIGPYQEQLEAYVQELQIIRNEKQTIADEAENLTLKYAEILGHQNHNQKIKHLTDLKMKSSELFQKNMELEAKNYKLTRTVEKLKREVEDIKKGGRRSKVGVEDKENLERCLKNVQSPGPLKDKNQFSNSIA